MNTLAVVIGVHPVILLVCGLLLPLPAYLLAPGLVRALLADLRLPRILHFVSLALLGMALHLREPAQLAAWGSGERLFWLPVLVLCLLYAAVFAIVTNNLEDLEADRISNPGRPLVQGRVAPRAYLVAGMVAQGVALLLAGLLHPQVLACIAVISAVYFVYSCRPFRLKRVPVLSKALIGFNSWVAALCGYAIAGGDWQAFPTAWSVFILVPLTLAANFVDLKDTAGDAATRVWTLPVLLGEARARHLIAAFTLAAYAMAGLLLGLAWVWPLNAGMAAAHLYFLYRKPYSEIRVFLVYIASVLGLSAFLMLSTCIPA